LDGSGIDFSPMADLDDVDASRNVVQRVHDSVAPLAHPVPIFIPSEFLASPRSEGIS